MLSQCALNLGPQPFGSDALLSQPLRHLLLGISKIFMWSCSIGFKLNDLSPRLNKRQFKDVPSNTCLSDSESRASDAND